MRQGEKAARQTERTQILAVDYGRARIGLAIADGATQLAKPLATLERINRNEDMRRLRELARDHGVRQIIVGLPLRLDGTRGEMAGEAERFAQRAAKQIGVPVEMVDERLTSWEAERLLEEKFGRVSHNATNPGGASKASGSGAASGAASVDAVAAAVILQEYLERRRGAGQDA